MKTTRAMKDRLFLSDSEKLLIKNKLKELTDSVGLHEVMGELLLQELKTSLSNQANDNLRNRARILGLM